MHGKLFTLLNFLLQSRRTNYHYSNKAQLRRLNEIHQKLGLKSPAELLSLKGQNDRKPLNKLKVFVGVIRAVARMRVDARKWGEHEKTRLRLLAAWEEKKKKQKTVLC